MADSGTIGQTVHVPPVFLQPIAADDVADALFKVVLEAPINGTIEIAGPERLRFSDAIQQYLKSIKDLRKVISDDDARYFGAKLSNNTLVPGKKIPSWFYRFEKLVAFLASQEASYITGATLTVDGGFLA